MAGALGVTGAVTSRARLMKNIMPGRTVGECNRPARVGKMLNRSRLSLVSHRAHSFVEHGCGVAHEVGGGKAAPEIEDAGSNGAAAARHAPHLPDDPDRLPV